MHRSHVKTVFKLNCLMVRVHSCFSLACRHSSFRHSTIKCWTVSGTRQMAQLAVSPMWSLWRPAVNLHWFIRSRVIETSFLRGLALYFNFVLVQVVIINHVKLVCPFIHEIETIKSYEKKITTVTYSITTMMRTKKMLNESSRCASSYKARRQLWVYSVRKAH